MIKAGSHVKLIGNHPWKGATGKVIALREEIRIGRTPLFDGGRVIEIELDGGGGGVPGHRCFAIHGEAMSIEEP